MNITEDPRLDPQRRRRQLRELLRRNDLTAALAVAVEVDHVEARRIAHRLIQDGAEWKVLGQASRFHNESPSMFWTRCLVHDFEQVYPLVSRHGADFCNRHPKAPHWLTLDCGARVPIEWTPRRALGAAREADTTETVAISETFPVDSANQVFRAECYAAAYQAVDPDGDREFDGAGVDFNDAWDRHGRDVITPLMLRWMLLPIEDVTS